MLGEVLGLESGDFLLKLSIELGVLHLKILQSLDAALDLGRQATVRASVRGLYECCNIYPQYRYPLNDEPPNNGIDQR